LLVARNEARLDEVRKALSVEFQVPIEVFPLDLARAGASTQLFEWTNQKGFEIEILINNAGVGLHGEHTDLPLERIGAMLQLNISSLTELCWLYGRPMKQRKSGRILNIASTAAYQPTAFFAAYGASKAFVLNFSEALAMELQDHGVTVSCLSPGPTDTAFFGEIDASGKDVAHFDKYGRDDARHVANVGIETLMSGKLSRIVGTKNYLRSLGNRFASRVMVAKVAKNMMHSSAS
jgi:uncharacterized protein